MGTLANSMFQVLLGWIRTLSAEIWTTLFSSPGRTTLLSWLGEHWKGLALLMCAAGMAVDLIVYLFRWQPYRVWRSRHQEKMEREEEDASEPDIEPMPEPIQYMNGSGRTDSQMEDIPEQRNHWLNPGEQWDDEAEDFPKGTDTAGEVRERMDPDAEEIPAQENEDPWQAYRRPAERYIRNAYDTESEEEQLAAWRQPEVNGSLPEEKERTTEKFEQAIRPRRRRSVRAMLTDRPEDQVPAPEQLIDQNEAYRRPVYPRSWQEGE